MVDVMANRYEIKMPKGLILWQYDDITHFANANFRLNRDEKRYCFRQQIVNTTDVFGELGLVLFDGDNTFVCTGQLKFPTTNDESGVFTLNSPVSLKLLYQAERIVIVQYKIVGAIEISTREVEMAQRSEHYTTLLNVSDILPHKGQYTYLISYPKGWLSVATTLGCVPNPSAAPELGIGQEIRRNLRYSTRIIEGQSAVVNLDALNADFKADQQILVRLLDGRLRAITIQHQITVRELKAIIVPSGFVHDAYLVCCGKLMTDGCIISDYCIFPLSVVEMRFRLRGGVPPNGTGEFVTAVIKVGAALWILLKMLGRYAKNNASTILSVGVAVCIGTFRCVTGRCFSSIGQRIDTVNDTLVEKSDEIIEKTDTLMGKTDTLIGKSDTLVGKSDTLIGKSDQLAKDVQKLQSCTDVTGKHVEMMFNAMAKQLSEELDETKQINELALSAIHHFIRVSATEDTKDDYARGMDRMGDLVQKSTALRTKKEAGKKVNEQPH